MYHSAIEISDTKFNVHTRHVFFAKMRQYGLFRGGTSMYLHANNTIN